MEEFFSEFAKAVKRGESLKVVELRGSKFRLHLDLDMKVSENKWTLHQILDIFAAEIATVVGSELSPSSFVVSGIEGRWVSTHQPLVTWKYGLHLVWPNLIVTPEEVLDYV